MDTEQQILNYLSYCRYQKGLDVKTIKAYHTDLMQFARFFSSSITPLSKQALKDYITHLNSHYQTKTVKRKLASLKAFFNYMEFEEIIVTNPMNKMRIKLHEPTVLPRTIPLVNIQLILQSAYHLKTILTKGSYKYTATLRDIAVLELLFATGIRVSELCFLQSDSIDLSEGTVLILGKGAKERLLQITNPQVLLALRDYAQAFKTQIQSTKWFFINRLGKRLSDQSVRFMINRYVQETGLKQHITPHMFRHSFATLLLEEDVDIRYIQQLLGHSSILTTQIYTHVASKKQRDIIATKHPRNKITL